jgi:hypothetical protein
MRSVTSAARLASLLALPLLWGAPRHGAVATISETELRAHVELLAGPALEGRDSPSLGLDLAARYVEQEFERYGLAPLGDEFVHGFGMSVPVPVAEGCRLELRPVQGEVVHFELGRDFVPLAGCEGEASGELLFLGFGIDAPKEQFDEIPPRGLERKVAVILEGEPRHRKRFDGEDTSPYAVLWTKLVDLAEAGAGGVIVVRRAVPHFAQLPPPLRDGQAPDVSFRHQFATWVGESSVPLPQGKRLPAVIEVDAECGARLLGVDVEALAEGADRSGKPPRHKFPSGAAPSVSFATQVVEREVPVPNVVGLVRGSDPARAEEYVLIGAHLDHVGVDERGRVGFGADDNASGTSALLEVAQALATQPPPRSVLLVAFGGEEKGLLGSKAFCARPPVPLESLVAMLNMDMIGRGERDEVAVLGVEHNPSLERVLERAQDLSRTGVKKLVLRQGQELWQRSDHYSFHERGVPALFFFEGLPISRNEDYHTWRDTLDKLDLDKMARTTRLVFNTAWLLASDPQRPPRPPG